MDFKNGFFNNFISRCIALKNKFFSSIQLDAKEGDTLGNRIAKSLTRAQVFLFLLILLAGTSYGTLSHFSSARGAKNVEAAVAKTIPPAVTILPQKYFENIELEAKAVYVLDVVNGKVLYEKNGNVPLPLASLVKVMTALVGSDLVPKDSVIEIDGNALSKEGDTGLALGEKWNFQELIDFTLLVSSNDGASAIREKADLILGERDGVGYQASDFIREMNVKVAELGLKDTRFLNETGLDENTEEAGGYGSARDMAQLFSFIITQKPRLLEATKYDGLMIKSLDGILHDLVNTRKNSLAIPSILGSKTGFTNLAQGNFLVAFDAGLRYPIVIAVLGSSQEGRFADAQRLANATLDYLNQK
ncbi:MAG: hypothetical protein ABI430_04835 [Candidatus Taylorbacteria bacterium]